MDQLLKKNEELSNKFSELETRLMAIEQYVESRNQQQIAYPLDDVSKGILPISAQKTGTSTAATQNINLTGNVQTITVPAQPTGTVTVKFDDGTSYNLLYS